MKDEKLLAKINKLKIVELNEMDIYINRDNSINDTTLNKSNNSYLFNSNILEDVSLINLDVN